MDNLIGPNPCEGCMFHKPEGGAGCAGPRFNNGVAGKDRLQGCAPYAAYAAKRELLEALKARGWYVPISGESHLPGLVKLNRPGWVCFIPQASKSPDKEGEG